MEQKRTLYIDMDDTICDFKGRYNEIRTANPNIFFPQSQYGFFTSLDPLPGTLESVEALREFYNVYILTRPSVMNPLCYTEKRIWVEKHFGMLFCHRLIICPNKSLMIGDYLVDDILWPHFRGKQILYGGHEFPNWDLTFNYLKSKFEQENGKEQGIYD